MAERKPKLQVRRHAQQRADTLVRSPAALNALGAYEARYRGFFDNANDVLALIALDGTIQDANNGAVRLLGWSKDELIGQHVRLVATPASVALAHQRAQDYLAGRKPTTATFDATLIRKDGSLVRVEARTRAVRDEHGAVVSFQGIFRDLTERTSLLDQLQDSEKRYRSIVEWCPDFVYVTDTTGRLLDANPVMLRWTGFSLAELRQKHFLDFYAGGEQEDLLRKFADLVRGVPVQALLIRAKNMAGEVRVFEINAVPLQEQGCVTAILSIGRDVTARYEIEAALIEHRRLRERIADALPQLVYVYDLHTRCIRLVNAQCVTLLGHTAEVIQATGDGLFGELLHPEDRTAVAHGHAALIAGDTLPSEQEFRVRHANGAYRWLRSHETVFTRMTDGEPWEILGLVEDITDRKRLEQMLKDTTVPVANLGKRLQAFRDRLGMTQPEFGARFGGYNQRQISNYETGRVEVPLELVLHIRAAGYPFEAVLGKVNATAIEETVAYLAGSHRERVLSRQLAAALTRLLDRDVATIERVLHAFGRPLPSLIGEQRLIDEQLRRLTVEPALEQKE